jgi:hypothetical protein
MIAKIFDFLRGLWNGAKENFLIIEQTNGAYEVTRASRNLKKKRIFITRNFLTKNLQDIKRLSGKTDRIVISLGSDLATTAESVITLKRSRPNDVINESEADQLVYQAFWDFLNRYRSLAAKKMRVNDLDLIAAYVQVRDISFGKNKILNPVGFNGPEISFRIRGTLIPRSLIPVLKRFKDWSRIFVFEKVSTLADVMKRAGLPDGGFDFSVQIEDKSSVIFRVTENEQVFKEIIEWGADSLGRAIAIDLGVNNETARLMLHSFLGGGVSDKMGKWLNRKISGSFENLAVLFEATAKDLKVTRPRFLLNFRLPERFPAKYLKKVHGTLLQVDEELERREFVINVKPGAADFNLIGHQGTLAIIAFEYDLPRFEAINKLLRRRVRWLIPNF